MAVSIRDDVTGRLAICNKLKVDGSGVSPSEGWLLRGRRERQSALP